MFQVSTPSIEFSSPTTSKVEAEIASNNIENHTENGVQVNEMTDEKDTSTVTSDEATKGNPTNGESK